MLRNGDFARRPRLGELLAAPLADRWRQFAPRPLAQWEAPQRSLLLRGAVTFAGFWGNYGWLQAPLPLALYALLALATAAAGVGLLRTLAARCCAAADPGGLAAGLWADPPANVPAHGRPRLAAAGPLSFPSPAAADRVAAGQGLDHWLHLDAQRPRRIGLALAVLAFNLVGLAMAASAGYGFRRKGDIGRIMPRSAAPATAGHSHELSIP